MARQGVALMRLSMGMESMPEKTREWLKLHANFIESEMRHTQSSVNGIEARIAEANEHLESMVRSRKKRG